MNYELWVMNYEFNSNAGETTLVTLANLSCSRNLRKRLDWSAY